jgi:protein-tyrosine phosphatase
VIDLHCHVLPGVDDGPATLEESVALARAARAAGITTLVATPHVSREYPTTSREVQDGVAAVNAALARAGVEVEVVRGAEVALDRGVDLDAGELAALRLGDGDWLLAECPLSPAAGEFDLLLHALRARGHRLVLAHPERSPALQRDPARVRALVRAGMACSITAASLVGGFGREARRLALHLVEAGLVHNVTSDAHDAVRRPPGLREPVLAAAVEAPALRGRLDWLTREVPRAILAGDDLPPPPIATPVRRRGWSWRR